MTTRLHLIDVTALGETGPLPMRGGTGRVKKAWGTTELVTVNPAFEFHRITIKAGGYCSIHRHQTKWNGFYIESGRLLIRTWMADGAPPCETIVERGEYSPVAAGVKHQFEALEDCVAFELYWAQYSPDDIERESEGGMR